MIRTYSVVVMIVLGELCRVTATITCLHPQSAGEVVSDAGIVESITLKNFMCHTHLGPFAFGSNVNFVVGNNGSECKCSASGVSQ